jgi:hypothetical protein
MQWRVVKLGIEQFDVLHAYGLAILLTTACGVPVALQDTVYCYTLSCPQVELPRVNVTFLLESVLPLPDEEELRLCDLHAQEQKLPVTVLDGLLAALFTTPGLRVLSVGDLLGKQRLDAEALTKGLHKVATRVSRWKAFARRTARRQGTDWLNNVLRDYDLERPVFPILMEGKYEGDIHVLMTIDPSFCFSLRSAQSLGRMTVKTQVAVRGPSPSTRRAACRFSFRPTRSLIRPRSGACSPSYSRSPDRKRCGAASRIRHCSLRGSSSRSHLRAACWSADGCLPSRAASAGACSPSGRRNCTPEEHRMNRRVS